jgi:predicted site-specific integrase-resolvase
MPDAPQDDLIGTTEAMSILDVSRATLTRWASAGRLPSVGQIGGRGALIFRRSDVQEMAAKIADQRSARAKALA